jgi:large subunit ribosomal protein L2
MKRFKATSPARRQYTVSDFSDLSKSKPFKGLLSKKTSSGGRNSFGRETNINIGGAHKKRYRIIDFKRDKFNIKGKVATIEYDPNRTSRIALIHYIDGEKRYILAPVGLKVGEYICSGQTVDVVPGNTMPLQSIPLGQSIHNIELKPGKGGQIVRSAGAYAQLVAKEDRYALIKLPSGETRKVLGKCLATIGIVSNAEHSNLVIGKAGRSRWLGIRPHNRGVTKNPVDHPMGGGEGRTSGGRHPVSPTAIATKGFKTRKNKRTEKYIVRKASAKK